MPHGPGINSPGYAVNGIMEPHQGNGRPAALDVPALSAQQRSALLEAMHAQLNLLTTQVNALTGKVNEHAQRLTNSQQQHETHWDRLTELRGFVHQSTFMARLRWLVLGR